MHLFLNLYFDVMHYFYFVYLYECLYMKIT